MNPKEKKQRFYFFYVENDFLCRKGKTVTLSTKYHCLSLNIYNGIISPSLNHVNRTPFIGQ